MNYHVLFSRFGTMKMHTWAKFTVNLKYISVNVKCETPTEKPKYDLA